MSSRPLLLLPPSETKRDGGNTALSAGSTGIADEPAPGGDPGALQWAGLEPIRARLVAELAAFSETPAAASALGLGARIAQRELDRNRALPTAPRMPAVLRYTGVLYDALDAASLPSAAYTWLTRHAAVHSALYGLVGAGEPIAAYRLSASSRLPAGSLRSRWRAAIGAELAEHRGLVIDLRSAGYATLGPAPAGAVRVEVVVRDGDGFRALNHFNKAAKGRLLRQLALAAAAGAEVAPPDAPALLDLIREHGGPAGLDAQLLEGDVLRVIVEP